MLLSRGTCRLYRRKLTGNESHLRAERALHVLLKGRLWMVDMRDRSQTLGSGSSERITHCAMSAFPRGLSDPVGACGWRCIRQPLSKPCGASRRYCIPLPRPRPQSPPSRRTTQVLQNLKNRRAALNTDVLLEIWTSPYPRTKRAPGTQTWLQSYSVEGLAGARSLILVGESGVKIRRSTSGDENMRL